MSKIHTINLADRGRSGATASFSGTVEELTESFAKILEDGSNLNPKINRYPKAAKSLVTALNKCVAELQSSNAYPDHYSLSAE